MIGEAKPARWLLKVLVKKDRQPNHDQTEEKAQENLSPPKRRYHVPAKELLSSTSLVRFGPSSPGYWRKWHQSKRPEQIEESGGKKSRAVI